MEPEDIEESSDLWAKVTKDPPVPTLDLPQLRMLRSEIRALVPAIHEVIDRANISAERRRKEAAVLAEKRLALMHRVLERMGWEAAAEAFHTWRDRRNESERELQRKLTTFPSSGEAHNGVTFLALALSIDCSLGPFVALSLSLPPFVPPSSPFSLLLC